MQVDQTLAPFFMMKNSIYLKRNFLVQILPYEMIIQDLKMMSGYRVWALQLTFLIYYFLTHIK